MKNTRKNDIKRVAILGIVANVFLLVFKVWIGLITRSQAMLADGMNSAGDVFASLMTYIGNHIASQPDDEDHPYGHGKAEYLFSMIISFSLILVAILVFSHSLQSLMRGDTFIFSYTLVTVSLITIVLKLLLFMYSHRVGRTYSSLLAIANAEDHRNDVVLTSLTLLSIITAKFNLSFVDGLAGMMIALWIGYTGITIFSSSYTVLMDTTLDKALIHTLKTEIDNVSGVDHLDSLVSKPVGLNYLLIVKVSISGKKTVAEGHTISAIIKSKLMTYELVDDVVVHINPTEQHPKSNYLR